MVPKLNSTLTYKQLLMIFYVVDVCNLWMWLKEYNVGSNSSREIISSADRGGVFC